MAKFLTEQKLDTLVPKWTQRLRQFASRFQPLRVSESALIVVDMQLDFLQKEGQMPLWGGPVIVPRVKRAIEVFRKCGRPVIYTKHCYRNPEKDGGATAEWQCLDRNSLLLREGMPHTEIHPDVAPVPDDYIIVKQRYSGFFATNLESILRGFKVRDVVIAGVASNACCQTTAHDAFFRDFHVFFLSDGTGGSDESAHIATLRDIAWLYGTVFTVAELTTQMQRRLRK